MLQSRKNGNELCLDARTTMEKHLRQDDDDDGEDVLLLLDLEQTNASDADVGKMGKRSAP